MYVRMNERLTGRPTQQTINRSKLTNKIKKEGMRERERWGGNIAKGQNYPHNEPKTSHHVDTDDVR